MRNNMKNKIVTHFYVKESWKNKKGEAPIYLIITINGERAEISTNRRVSPAATYTRFSGEDIYFRGYLE
jgi:hypothetical protein